MATGKPLDRYQENFKDEQRAKMHAFDVLRNSGKQAQSILRHTCKIGRCDSRSVMYRLVARPADLECIAMKCSSQLVSASAKIWTQAILARPGLT